MRYSLLLALLCSTIFGASAVDDLLTLKAEYPVYYGDLPVALSDALEDALYERGIEIRQQIRYDAPARQLIVWTFIVQPGAPYPTSLVDVQNNQLDYFRVDVGAVGFMESSWRTVEFAGTVAAPVTTPLMVAGGMTTTVSGAVPGATVRLTVSYLPESVDPRLGTTRLLVAGGAAILAPEAYGRVVLERAPNRAPVAVVIRPEPETSNFEIGFDATASWDPDRDDLDYKWHVLGGTVSLRGCETPTPVFQFNSGPGEYDFRLTLTDARGATTVSTFRVRYSGR